MRFSREGNALLLAVIVINCDSDKMMNTTVAMIAMIAVITASTFKTVFVLLERRLGF